MSNLKEYNLLDVRTDKERREYSIGGIHISLDELANRIAEIRVNKLLVVYCQSGERSRKAIIMIKDQTYNELINLKGGL